MKKIIGLVLFFVTNISVAGTLSLQNNLSGNDKAWVILCQVTYKNGTTKDIQIKQNERMPLGESISIAKIFTTTYLGNLSWFGEYGAAPLLGSAVRRWDNLTDEFLTVIRGHENDDFLITVEWKYPDSYGSREWNYTFENLTRLHKFKFGSLDK